MLRTSGFDATEEELYQLGSRAPGGWSGGAAGPAPRRAAGKTAEKR